MPIRKQLILSVILVMIVLLIIVPIYIIKKRNSIYPYKVSMDYIYSFNQTNAYITRLSLKNGRVDLPKDKNKYQTAFLKVNVDSVLMGKYIQPSIEIIAGKSSVTQYIEHGAKGVRYLNLSSLLSKNETEIRLKGNYVSIYNQSTQLIGFKNKSINKQKILIIAPHPDDAELAAYGLYSSDKKSYILTITAGDAGDDKYDEIYPNKAKQYLKKGQLRTWNSITVPLLGGVPIEQCVNLGFFDGTLKSMYRNKFSVISGRDTGTSDISTFRKQNISSLAKGLIGKSDWNSLVINIGYILKMVKPDIIVTPYPVLDRHDDHKLSSIAVFDAIKKVGMHKGLLFLYTNHLVLNEYYPYGNIGGVVSLPPYLGKAIYFDSIYSHGLSMDTQKDKIFALEAMNDLRLDTEWRFSQGAVRLAFSNLERDIKGKNKSYYRRFVRSNELFFVVNISDIYDGKKLNRIIGEL